MIKVENLIDNTYQVVRKQEKFDDEDGFNYLETVETLHQGSLADCEAYIKLMEGGYL